MEDPKKPKQLTEASPLDEFTATGNIYVDPAYTAGATPETSPLTGEALTFGTNAFADFTANGNASPAVNPGDTHAIFVTNLKRGTDRNQSRNNFIFNFNRNKVLGDIYISTAVGGDFSISPRVADTYVADSDGTLSVYIEKADFGGNLMGFGSQANLNQKFTGNLEFTFKNSRAQWFCITYGTGYGLGEANRDNNRYGTFYGNIDLVVDGSTITNNGAIVRGAMLPDPNTTDEKVYLRAYINNSLFQGEFGVIQNGCDNNGTGAQFKSNVDVDITVEGSTFTNVFLMFPNSATNTQAKDGKLTITGDVNFKASTTSFAGLNMGAGLGGTGWNRTGWIKGDIKFDIDHSTNSSRTFVHKGFVGEKGKPNVVEGTLSNSVFGDFTGYDTRENNYIYADTTLKMVESTIGNFTFYNTINSNGNVTPTAERVFGAQTLELTGTTAGTVAGNGPAAAQSGATFDLVFHASDTVSVTGAISNWNSMTVDAGAKVRAASISLKIGEALGTLNLAIGSALNTADLAGIATINVTGEVPTGDTILVSGLTIAKLEDGTKVMLGETELSYGLFGGQYSITNKGDLVIHNGQTYLVNSEYTDGQATTLGPTGYSTIAAAQAAIADPTKTSITVYGLDEAHMGNTLDEDVTTKDFTIVFTTDDDHHIEFNNHDLLIGSAAGVDNASVTISYTDNIKAVTFGNITNKAAVAIDNSEIGSLNLTGAVVGDADLAFDTVVFDEVKLADQAGFKGTLTIANSTIGDVYGGASGLDVDMTGANTITNVYAEGNASAIKLGTSEVNKFVAGYSDVKSVTTLDYEGTVNADELIIGGDDKKNTIGTLNAKITGGSVNTLRLGGTSDAITGDANITFEGGEIDNVAFGEIGGKANITLKGGHFTNGFEVYNVAGKTTVTLAGGTVAASQTDGKFYGIVYGASVSGALDGGQTGTDLIVDGNAKVESVKNFTALNVTGGTLNVAGGESRSEVGDGNTIEIDGDITNRRGINAGGITAKNLTNYGLIGVLREDADDPGITLSGNLVNASYIKTANLTVDGNFTNTGKITSVGDITVSGSFSNSGEIYFRSTFSQDGEFSQEGGLALNNVDVNNTGFISAATLTGVKNLTTSKMYVTGGAVITGSLTINAGAEVAFTNKADDSVVNGLTLGGTITMSDTSALIVSGELTTDGTKTLTVNCGDLLGVNELVRAESGVSAWTIKLTGAKAGNYAYVQDDVSVVIYSTDEVFVCTDFDEDSDNFYKGNKLLYGKNAFATVAEAVAAAKSGAKIHLVGDFKDTDVAAANFDVILEDATNIAGMTAKTVTVISDSSVKSIVAANGLTINASALLTVAETLPTNLPITIDGSAGTGSRLVLDVDPQFQTLNIGQITVKSASGKTYTARILDGETAHAGDLYIVSQDNLFFRKDQTGAEPVAIVDGELFDGATGDALFNGVNIFNDRAAAEALAKTNGGTVYLVGFTGNEIRNDESVPTAYEFASDGNDIYGSEGDGYGTATEANKANHTTIISGTTTAATIYGLNQYVNMTGDYTFIAEGTVQTANNLWIMGNTHSNVMNGNITAEITGSTFQNVYLGTGSFGTDETKPINIDITIRDSKINGFYGIHTQRDNNDPTNRQDINANFTVRIYDSFIDGGTVTFMNTNNDHYGRDGSGNPDDGVTQLQTYYTAGSITLELGGVNMPDGNIRIGSSLEVCGKATQAFNVPITVHVVATENSTVTHCDWVCDVDTLIIDATAQLLIDNALQYTTVDKDAANASDYAPTLTQVMINMSGYKSGTHNVIQANYAPSYSGTRGIYTDNALSNITVIGDNDLTGQCELAYLTQTRDGDTYLNAVYVFDKSDDMFVNPNYTDAINGTSDSVTGQEFLLNYNAHTDFAKALFYANDWGGTITVTGGEWEDVDFEGNDVTIRKGASFESVTMAASEAAWDEATLTIEDGVEIGVIDGSKANVFSTLLVENDASFAIVKDFSDIVVVDATATFASLSGSNLSITAGSMIVADELDMAGSTLTIDVTGYVGRPHVIAAADELTGFDASSVTIEGENKDKFSVIQVDNNIVLKTTIPSDTFLNSTYSEATTGTILPDGTYLEYGFNAFSDGASALKGLGSRSNTLTITGGENAGDLVMNGANFALTEGSLDGIVYATYEKDYRNMSITVGNGSVGGIEMTAQEGSYRVTRGVITLEDGAIITGSLVGAGDTSVTVTGDVSVAQGIEGIKSLVVDAMGCISASSIEMAEGGTIKITGSAKYEGTNLHKVIDTDSGYSVEATADAGLYLYKQGNDLYVLSLSRIYYDPSYTAEITGTTHANGDILIYGVNAFSDRQASTDATVTGATTYVNGRNGNYHTSNRALSLYITNSNMGVIVSGMTSGNLTTNGDVNIYIETTTFGQDGDSRLLNWVTAGSPWSNHNHILGNVSVVVNASTIGGNNNHLVNVADYFDFSGTTFEFKLIDTIVRNDIEVMGDSNLRDGQTIYWTMDGVIAPADKWWWVMDGNAGNGGDIVFTIKDSSLGTSANDNFQLASQSNWNFGTPTSTTNFTFNVENSTVYGSISPDRIGRDELANYSGNKVLNVYGENRILRTLWFKEINLTQDSFLQGNVLQMSTAGGKVNIDVTGYTGPSKSFIYMRDSITGLGEEDVNVIGGEGYQLVQTANAIVLFDGTIGNIYWNPNYAVAQTGTTSAFGDVLFVEGTEGLTIANAFNAEVVEDISGLDRAKLALTEGNKLYVTGTGADFNGELYGTLESQEITEGDINMVVADGDFSKTRVDPWGETVGSIIAAANIWDPEGEHVFTGNSTIEIAGGTYGKAATDDAPAVFADINGTREVSGGTSGLLVTYSTDNLYANLTDFDYMSVQGTIRVRGDISMVDSLSIDCNGSLTVDGNLDAASIGSIVLSSMDYEGPSKIVLHSDNLSQDIIDAIEITVDNPADRWFYDGGKNLWLVSSDPSNIYVNDTYNAGITGTTFSYVDGGTTYTDLLYYGVNAESDMATAVAKATSDYRFTVTGGVFAGDYDMSSIGRSSIYIDGGTIGSLTVGNTEGENLSRIELTGATAKAAIGTINGDEAGYRLIMDKDAKVTTANNVQYIRIGLEQATSLYAANYIAEGGRFVLDLSGFNGHAGNVLSIAGGLNNFLIPVEGETYTLAHVEATNDATHDYGFYYDEASKNIVAVAMGANAYIRPDANSSMTGTVVDDTKLVYGFNVTSDGTAASYAKGGTVFINDTLTGTAVMAENDVNAVIKNSALGATQFGVTGSTANAHVRQGDFSLEVVGGTFNAQTAFAGRGSGSGSDARTTLIVGTQASEGAEIVDGVYNLTFKALKDEAGEIVARSRHNDNGFRIAQYANVAGGTVNVLFEDYYFRGDLKLFESVWNVGDQELDVINVTITGSTCPQDKWMWIWDPREANSTTVNLTITDTLFSGDTMGVGLFGDHTTDWDGKATVTISGVTVTGGNHSAILSGGRGIGSSGSGQGDGVKGERTLKVIGDSTADRVIQFTKIDIADGVKLTGTLIDLPVGTAGDAGFILRGETGYTGDVKEYVVVGTTITGGANVDITGNAEFLDANDQAIAGYTAVVGSTSVFIYKQDGAVYYDNSYTAATTGTAVEADALTGKKNFLVFGDNAVAKMEDAYTSADLREKQLIVVENTNDAKLYANGYKLIVNGGSIDELSGSAFIPEPVEGEEPAAVSDVAFADITVNKDASINTLIVASETSKVTGDALVTVADEATLGVLNGAEAFVGGSSKLVFNGNASVFSIAGFDDVTIQANSELVISRTFSGASLTIDVTGFTGASKRVMTVNGGVDPEVALTINAGTFGTEWVNDGKVLVLVSSVVTDVYVNTAWTEADVTGKFVGDMLLVWNKNAFGTLSSAATQAVGADSTLYVSGNFQSADALAFSNASVILQGATVGLGAVTASGTALTVESTQFTAASLSGISELSVKADAVAIGGAIAMTGEGKLTIDVTGHTQSTNDVVVLTTEGGITGLDKDITVTGDDASHYYAYYSEKDGDIHLLRIDNMYVDVAFGTAGEGIKEGDTHPITHEPYVFGANAFYTVEDAVAKIADGMGLYVNSYSSALNTNNVVTDLYLTNSDIPVLINGFTNGDITYTGDVNITIMDSTFGAEGNSTIVSKVMVADPWNHVNTLSGNVKVDISGSTIGSETAARTVNGADYLRVNDGNFTFNVSDSVIYANLEVLGDSPIGNSEVVSASFKNVTASVAGRNIWITDGNQNNAGTIEVTLDKVNFGDIQVATQSDWNYGDRNSSNKVTFNVSDATIGGSISADCIGREELTGYTGNKVLNITGGSNAIAQVLWFKEINIDASASTLNANVINMSSASAKVVVDATKFSGKSRVIVSAAEGIANLTGDDVSGKFAAESTYEVFTDYNAEAKTMTSIVVKGDLKDIYANEDYTLEDLTIGTTYNGEALFCNFNAFDTADAALAALTVEGASLFVTGNLSYEGPEGQVLTINNDLINDGTFKLSSKGFVDGTNTDVVVLTATSITGTGKFTTDNAAYTAVVRDNSVYLVLKKVDVYVSTTWAELEDGSIVEIPGGTATIGTDAFAVADDAAAKVSANGTITVLASDVKFSSAIVRTVTATSGSTIQNANIGTANGAGSLTLESGATATNAQVRNGTLTVSDGASVTGGLKITEGAAVSFGANTALDLDISAMTVESGAVMTGYSIMTGSPAISITIAADQADGTYAIATDAATFGTQAVTLKTVAATITSDLTLGNTQTIEGIEYTLGMTDDNVLTLTKKVYEEPITVTYVNPAWAEYEDGTVVTVTGATAIVGKDAFADADLATEKVISTGIVKVVAGTVTFANGITKQTEILSGAELTNTNVSSVLTVNAGATLSGKAAFAEGATVTVNGTVVFDLALSAESAQFTGFAVAGEAQYKLVGEAAAGDYTLATGVTAFTSLTVGDQTLAVGESIIVNDAFTYALALNEGTLALSIAEYVPPVVIPTITYVNSAWITKQEGAKFTLDDGTQVTYKYDAFATGDEAIAAVSADGEVKVLGGTVSFTDAIAKAVTISADATLFGKATFSTAITIDGTVAFDTALTADGAQITGLSKVTGATKYTLSAAATVGVYTLATDAAGFNSDVAFNGNVLKVGAEATTIGDFTYQLAITDNSELALTIAAKPVPPTPTDYVAKSDIDGNGISDVMFVWTGNNYQHGYWMNGTSTWQSVGVGHPADWDNLGCYDMTGDGKADSVLFGNVTTEAGIKGAYIGYYADANDADANWVTIGYLTNEDDIVWKNAVGNLTGNEKGTNSIVWYAPELYALGAWTDGTETWAQISGTFGGTDWTLVGCGDFDGDGKDSIVMSGLNGQYFYAANVDGTSASMGDANWSGWEVRAIGDFLGDGKDDMVLFHKEYGSMVMLANGNLDDFTSIGQLDAADWFVVGAGDYNNDQKDDLLVRQYSTGMLGYYVSGDTNQWVELGRGVDMNWTVIA